MPTYEIKSYSEEALLQNINLAKSILLYQLFEEGKLDKDTYEKLDSEWFFVVQKLSSISSLWNKLCGNADKERLLLVKSTNLRPNL